MRSSTIHRLLCCGRNNTTNNRKHAVSTIIQVLFITLRLLASGSFLQVITDNFLGFDESTARRVVRRVTQALTTKLGDFDVSFSMCRKSCLLIYFFKKLVGTFERNFCPRGENFNKAIFKSSNTWGAARKKRERCQRFQLIVILLIKGIKIKTIM